MPISNVNKDSFLSILQSVQSGLSQREKEIEQSSCLAFVDGFVMTFNDEISCRAKSNLPKSFRGAVQAKPLIEILKRIPDKEIELDTTDSLLIIKGIRKKTELRMEQEIVLSLDMVEKPTEWKQLPEGFDGVLEIVPSCALKDKNDTRFDLSCVHFTKDFIEASDCVQVARYNMKLDISKEFLIKKESIKAIENLGMTEYAETDSWFHFRNESELIISVRRYMEEFPNLDDIIDTAGDAVEFPLGLAEAAKSAAVFSKENHDDDKILLELKSNKCRITGRGISGKHSSWVELKYNGGFISFLISPKILEAISSKYRSVEICSKQRGDGVVKSLKVHTDKFDYLSCLSSASDDEDTPKATEKPEKKSNEETSDE